MKITSVKDGVILLRDKRMATLECDDGSISL